MEKDDDYALSQINGVEACLNKVKVKKTNGIEWMLLDAPCLCKYSGETKIYYCRNKQVYFARHNNEDQLRLPFIRLWRRT